MAHLKKIKKGACLRITGLQLSANLLQHSKIICIHFFVFVLLFDLFLQLRFDSLCLSLFLLRRSPQEEVITEKTRLYSSLEEFFLI